jgi:hypothetical protein
MKLLFRRFNIILFVVALGLFAGCKTAEEKKKAKEATFLRFHLETNPDGTRHNAPVPVYRANPILVNIERDASLDEGFMKKAELVTVDDFGNYALKITFDETGTQRLDYLTTMNKGRRLVVNARWTETRFLAAPLITKRIADGVFIFTPDATREECERIVAGLNNVIAKLKKPYTII